MSIESIAIQLKEAGFTLAGSAAIIGNILGESTGFSNNLQDSYERKLGHTDTSYTLAIDNGQISREQFGYDQAGYGLCQWTYRPRKLNLYDFVKAKGVSIGNEKAQIEFMIIELKTSYNVLYKELLKTVDVNTCCDWFCRDFENPAVKNYNDRRNYAWQFINDFSYIFEETKISEETECEACMINYGAKIYLPDVEMFEHGSNAKFLKAMLEELGYDVCWLGMGPCITDFQQKMNLPITGKCDRKTWETIFEKLGK